MDIAALVNPVSEALPRRSSSGSHNHIPAPSPALSSATLPATPTHKPTLVSAMNRKRKRHDPVPIWAVRENEVFDGKTLQQHLNERQPFQPQSQPQPQPQAQPQPQPQARPSPSQAQPPAPSAPQAMASAPLSSYERPISGDRRVYDEVQRQVCDFLFNNIIVNDAVRKILQEAPDTTVEVEARWGQILRRDTEERLQGQHMTECVIKREITNSSTRFESTMTVQQHQNMNKYLNKQVHDSKPGNPTNRPMITYTHTKTTDQQFELDDEAAAQLSPAAQNIIKLDGKRARIRVSRDQKTGEVVAAIIKHKVINLEISSPRTEWDYRIGINLEIIFPGSLDGLTEVVEKGRPADAMKRHKDRMSYSYMDGAFQVDLTQVTQDNQKIHELELELSSDILIDHGERVRAGQPSEYETLVNGMINNLRVLSREMTPPKRSM